ncbi:MAG: hypothetical protein ACXADA_22300 [Candidatus Hodarchaeales archaeon]|jgi:hypothetical protein
MFNLKDEENKKLEGIIREKKLLDAVIAYYIEKKNFDEISTELGISPKIFQQYLSDNDYPHLFAADLSVIRDKLETRLLELEEQREEIETKMKTRQEEKEKLDKQVDLKSRLAELEKEKEAIEAELKASGSTSESLIPQESYPSRTSYRDTLKPTPKIKINQKGIETTKTKDYQAELKPQSKIDTQPQELRRIISESRSDELGSLTQILFIPSWTNLLGSGEFLGFYLNQPVYEILQDSLVILPDFILTGYEKTMGEPFIFLSGLGIYFVKFRLTPGEVITDYREITGFVLPMSIYEKAQDMSTSMVDSSKLQMTEYMVSVPFSLILARQTTQMYIRGVVARNVVHPYKECFDKLLDVSGDTKSFVEDEGLKILSGGLSTKIPLYTNELLTEKKLGNYSKLTAGIKNCQPKLEKILADLQIEGMKSRIFENIRQLKKDYIEIGHPKLLDWVP